MIITPHSGRKVANNINKWNTKQVELAKPRATTPSVNNLPIVPKQVNPIV
jgi:hypothetical protein